MSDHNRFSCSETCVVILSTVFLLLAIMSLAAVSYWFFNKKNIAREESRQDEDTRRLVQSIHDVLSRQESAERLEADEAII